MPKFEAKKEDFAKIWQKLGGGGLEPPPWLHHPWIARLIFDVGSQRSYLRHTVRDKLNLETCSRATILINAFGQSLEQLQTCDQVQFTVGSLNDSFQTTIDAYVVPEICAPPPPPFQRQEIREAQYCYPYLQGIKLAESCKESEDMEIDLLVWGDHVWKFPLNEVIRGENDLEGPVAVNTRVGWVLSGPVQIESKETLSGVNFVATTHVLKVGNTP